MISNLLVISGLIERILLGDLYMIKYCKKVDTDKYLIIDTDEYNKFLFTNDTDLDTFSPLYITEKQKHFFSSCGRWFNIVSYLPRKLIDELLTNYDDYITKYIFIKHDCDEGKKLHYHILINTSNSCHCSFFVRLFHTTNVKLLESTNKVLMKNAVLYLTHESQKAIIEKKYIYPIDDLVSNDLNFWFYYRNYDLDGYNVAYLIINDMLNGRSHIELVRDYGQNYVVNYTKYQQMKELILSELNNKK